MTQETKHNLDGLIDRLVEYKRQNIDLTYKDLGKSIGVSENIAYDICSGRRKFFTLETIEKILALLEV